MTLLLPAETWTKKQKIIFRFLAVYFILALFPFPLNAFPFTEEIADEVSGFFWDPLVYFTGDHLFHIPGGITIKPNGSGDTTYNYVQQFLFLVLSLLACTIWGIAAGKQGSYNRFLVYITALVRYYLAFIMLLYGFSKVFPTQFPFPSLFTLIEPYGQSSPMHLAWSFFGYSEAYGRFTGLMEVAAGSLLFFRKTTLAGALLAVAIMINVLAINLCYDIPVKLYAMNLIFMGLFLIAPYTARLYDFFIRNRATVPVSYKRRITKKRSRLVESSLKIILFAGALYSNITDNYHYYREYEIKSPLYGIYTVDNFRVNQALLPPLQTDSARWKKLVIDKPGFAGIQQMNDSMTIYRLETDTLEKKMTLYSLTDTIPSYSFIYTLPDTERLYLYGKARTDSIRIEMSRFDLSRFTLINRKFRWISERPYNR
jgi:hypothetical protein